jgi:hypothetical protein
MYNHIDDLLVDNKLEIKNLLSKEGILHKTKYLDPNFKSGPSAPSISLF